MSFHIIDENCLPQPDVLILGGGLAALCAAAAVLKEKRSVAVLSQGKAGASGNTVVSNTKFACCGPEEGNDWAAFQQDILLSGQELADPVLAGCLARDSENAWRRLESLGVRMQQENGRDMRVRAPGHSLPRSLTADSGTFAYSSRGMALLTPLAARLREGNVQLWNGLQAVELLVADGRTAGVLALNTKNGRLCKVMAGRVIIATGGYGGLFAHSNNVAGIHGAGLSLALRHGCPLRDLEMVQFFPVNVFDPIKTAFDTNLFQVGALLRNSEGAEFMHRYDPDGHMAKRDSMARAVFLETQAGRGINGCVYVDCTSIPSDELQRRGGQLCAMLQKKGLDLHKDWIKASPCAHYSLGGVCIDEYGRGTLPGLYVAGEACGGVHGANRIGGAGLLEAAVFGYRAGTAAALDMLPATKLTSALPENIGALTAQERPEDAAALDDDLKKLRGCLWEHVSLVRTNKGLQSALGFIRNLRDKWSPQKGAGAHLFRGKLLLAEGMAISALQRTESRGAHFRSDCPEQDPKQGASIICSLEQGELRLRAAAKCAKLTPRALLSGS